MNNWYKISQSGASLQWTVDTSRKTPSVVIQAIGNTYPIKDKLKEAGFTWDGDNRVWSAKYSYIYNRLNAISEIVGLPVPDVSTIPEEYHYLVGLAPKPEKAKRKLLIPRPLTNLLSFLIRRRVPNFIGGHGINKMVTDSPVIAMYEFIEPKSFQSLNNDDLQRLVWPFKYKQKFDDAKYLYEDLIKPFFDYERKDPEMYDFLTSESVSNDHPVLQRADDPTHWDSGSFYTKPDNAKEMLHSLRSSIHFSLHELQAYRDLFGPNGDALKQECERKIAAIDQMTPRNNGILKLLRRDYSGSIIIKNPHGWAQRYPELFAKTPDHTQRFPGDGLGFHQITPDEIDGLVDELVQLGFLRR